MPKSEPAWFDHESTRDIGIELLNSISEMKAGLTGRVTEVNQHWVTQIRLQTGLSRETFAKLFGVSVRTLAEWENGHRNPVGAAKSLLKIAEKYPNLVQELATS